MRISRSGEYIGQIMHIGGRVFEKLLQQSGVTDLNGPQGKILDALWQADGLTARALGERTGLAGSTLTSMLDRMENAGLVTRERSPEDRRSVRIRLTEKAQALRRDYEAVSEKMTEIYFEGFAEDEISSFEDSLRRVLANVKLAEQSASRPNASDPDA